MDVETCSKWSKTYRTEIVIVQIRAEKWLFDFEQLEVEFKQSQFNFRLFKLYQFEPDFEGGRTIIYQNQTIKHFNCDC